jgi:hypothetical protein
MQSLSALIMCTNSGRVNNAVDAARFCIVEGVDVVNRLSHWSPGGASLLAGPSLLAQPLAEWTANCGRAGGSPVSPVLPVLTLSPGHVKRRSLPLLRQLAALRRCQRECGRHGQEGPHLPLVRARRPQTW